MSEAKVGCGPLRFGDDEPGVYIRGENARAFAASLRAVLSGKAGPVDRGLTEGLLDSLLGQRCNFGGEVSPAGVLRMKPAAECVAPPKHRFEDFTRETPCPECGGELDYGYGFMCGALGAYTFCVGDGCGFVVVRPDPIEEDE